MAARLRRRGSRVPGELDWIIGTRPGRTAGHLVDDQPARQGYPRIVCDWPHAGMRWVHHLAEYVREHRSAALPYYDPISTAPEASGLIGQIVQHVQKAAEGPFRLR